MFGTYQHSNLRIEIEASADKIGRSLTELERLQQWLRPQQIRLSQQEGSAGSESMSWSASGPTARLAVGQALDSTLGFVRVHHQVEKLSAFGVRFLLSGSIDGFHEWQWGDGWVQSRLEGVSLLPLNLGQTLSLARLKHYLQQ
jgi:hypothetical protein